jgi:hypothetical protein
VVKQFRSVEEAEHYFTRVLGWYSDGGYVWYDNEAVLPSFIAVPRFSHGTMATLLDVDVGALVSIWVITSQVAGVRGQFEAFYFQANGGGHYDFDPILSLASPAPLSIGAIGAWPSTMVAVEAAKHFCLNLLELYGHDYFRKCVDAHVRGELHVNSLRHEFPVDAKATGRVYRPAAGSVGEGQAVGDQGGSSKLQV